ncbi:MAG: hypothetical protein SGI73_07810 [Chloroflexota bacterium]|nr:hypothetical protein [Chloroflexota bacterium]
MTHIVRNPAALPAPVGQYAHAIEVRPNARYLFVSGQIPGAEHTDALGADFGISEHERAPHRQSDHLSYAS